MLNREQLNQWREWAADCYPDEAAAVLYANGMLELHRGGPTSYALSAKCVKDGLSCLVHSHPDGPDWPSEADMQAQMALDIPFGLSVSTAGECTAPWYWGDGIKAPLTGREFRHGPTGSDGRGDCYALIRDYYAEQGITLEEVPRGDNWWSEGKNLYDDLLQPWGFEEIDPKEVQPGDLLLFQLPKSPVINHGGIYLDGGLLLHHLDNRLSTVEPLGRWRPYLRKAARHNANR